MKRLVLRLSFAVALACGANAPASMFSVAGSGSTFTVTRDDASAAERVFYRAVSRTAIAGAHFQPAEGYLDFAAGQLTNRVTVAERTAAQINNPCFVYYQYGGTVGSSRAYRFEVVDGGGFVLADANRTISYDASKSVSSSAFDENALTVSSGEITVTDKGFTQAYHAVPCESYLSSLPQDYLAASDARIRMTLDFQAAEVSDGYQYLQIVTNTTTACDNANSADGGDPGTPTISPYLAGFEHEHGSKNPNYKKYSFPVTSAGSNCGAVATPWSDLGNDIGNLCQQRFRSDARADDGRIALLPSISSLGIRFDASGSDNDDWKAKSVVARLQAVPAAPSPVGNPVLSSAPVCKGSTVTVSLAFNQIMTVAGTPTLVTSWGDLPYAAGSGANVLTFSGTVTAAAGTQLRVTGLSGGTVTGLAGNAFSWPGNLTISGRTVDSLPEPPHDAAGFFLLSTPAHLRWFADRIASYPNTSAALACDIDLSAAVSAGGSFPAMGGDAGFAGVFDGRGHALSGLKVASPDSSGASPARYGLFGLVAAQGVITNLVLSGATVTAPASPALVGAVCGRNLGTIDHCSVSGGVLSTGPYQGDGSGSALGGVCGENAGAVRACRVVGPLASSGAVLYNRVSNDAVGGVAGVNAASGTLEACYFHAGFSDVTHGNVTRGAVCGSNAGTVLNCVGVHYDGNYFGGCIGSNAGIADNVPFLDAGTPFAGGAACYALNGGVTDGSQPWYQMLGLDDLPLFAGPTVHRHGSEGYVNTIEHVWIVSFEHSPDYSNGVWTATCTVCDETDTFTATGTAEVTRQPTCTEPGTTTWTYVPPANDYGITVAATAVQSGVPAALGHDWGAPGYTWAEGGTSATASASCIRSGCGATTNETVAAALVPGLSLAPSCTAPGTNTFAAAFSSPLFAPQTNAFEVAALGHAWGAPTYVWAADGSAATASNACTRCGETAQETVAAALVPDLSFVPACTMPGTNTYAAAFHPPFAPQTNAFEVAALGHVWGAPTYVWAADGSAATASNACTRCGETARETVAPALVPGLSLAPSCTAPGTNTFAAAFSSPLFAPQTNAFELAALGHAWDAPTYVWAADGSTATASNACTRCGETAQETVAPALVPGLSFAPACTVPGTNTYAAAFHPPFAPQTNAFETAPAIGHDWTGPVWNWNAGYTAATAAFTCSRGDTEETVAAAVARVPAGDGTTNCTATAVHHGETFTDTVTIRPPVSYIDSDGVERQCVRYTVLVDGHWAWGERNAENWYVVANDVTSTDGFLWFLDAHAHIILCDGATLTLNANDDNPIFASGNLTIYGQSGDTGAILANATGEKDAIYVGGDFTVNGGILEASTTGNPDTYYGYDVTRTVTINGGVVRGSVCGGRGLAVNGGMVESAKLGTYNGYDIVLGWRNATDGITAAAYSTRSVSVKAGQALTDGTAVYQGEVDPAAIAGKTLRPGLSWRQLQAMLDAGGAVTIPNDVTAADGDATLTVTNAVTLDLNGHTIDADGRFRVIEIRAGGDLALTNGVEGTGAVTGGSDDYGAGVSVGSNAVFRLQGGAIAGNAVTNEVDARGGGVFVSNGGTFEMSGGSITNNTVNGRVQIGGGVFVSRNGTFTMSGGEISGNTADDAGGGVYVDGGAFTMTGGEISGNTTVYFGGGVDMSAGTFTMSGGAISGNAAVHYGGGVFANGNCSFTMSGGAISGNAAGHGGGVFVCGDYTFTLSGSPVVSGNANSVGAANNVHLYQDSTLYVDGLSSGASIGVTTETAPTESSPVPFATGAAAGDAAHFFSDNPAFAVEAVNGELRLREPTTPWSWLQAQLDAGGTVTLANDVTATSRDATLTVTTSVTLDLNGHTINAVGRFGVIEIRNGGDFTLTNGVPGSGAITGGNASNGGGVYVTGGAFTMAGGAIAGNTADYGGGGVYVDGGAFTMTGGEISGNTADYGGGGVYVDGGAFAVSGRPVVSGNTNRARAPNNVCLSWGTIAVNGLSAGASIGVTTANAPTVASPVTFATGTAEGDKEFFTSDKPGFSIDAANGELRLVKPPATPWDFLQVQLNAGGTVTLTNDVTATDGDATLVVATAVTLDLNGHTIDAAGKFGVILVRANGDFTLTNGVPGSGAVTGGRASEGGGVCVWGAFTMAGGTISGNAADYGGGVSVWSGGAFTVSGRSVVSGNTDSVGAANDVWLRSGCTIAVDGLSADASIGVTTEAAPTVASPVTFATGASAGDKSHFFSDKPAFAIDAANDELLLWKTTTPWDLLQAQLDAGGAVTLADDVTAIGGDATLTVTNAVTLDLNGHTLDAAGNFQVIKIRAGGDLTLTNGVPESGAITGGTAISGGGVLVDRNGVFTMAGGAISGNTSSTGGGVYVNRTGAFTMAGGEISGNASSGGGGVLVGEDGAFTMSGGTISGNAADYGGGVSVYDNGAFTMAGGAISGNTAADGGGVYGAFTVSGSPVVSGNTNSVGAANNVYLRSGRTIAVDGLSAGASIGVTTKTAPTESSPVAFATGAAEGDEAHFKSDAPGFAVERVDDKLRLRTLRPWERLQAQLDAGGTVTLAGDATATDGDATLVVTNTVTLNLNGHTIDADRRFCVIQVLRNGDLTLTNSVEGTGAIVNGYDRNLSGGVYVNCGTFTMAGGAIAGNGVARSSFSLYGGGVYVSDGTFTMTGGAISNNVASDRGGGVYVDGGAFTMSGGEIAGNTANGSGGGVYIYSGRFTLAGGTIANNVAYARGSDANRGGGGVFIAESATFAMSGGTILTNAIPSADKAYGGGVLVAGGGTSQNASDDFTMTGGTISENYVTTSSTGNVWIEGGGVSVTRGKFTMSGGEISGNLSSKNGGGVSVRSNSIFMMTGGIIAGNTAECREDSNTYGGGGVYVADSTFTMIDSTISGNVVYADGTDSSKGGGGAYLRTGTFRVSGVSVVSGNTNSVGAANNVYLPSGKKIAISGLSAGASIGVTTDPAPTESSPVAFATGASEGDEAHFFSDDPSFRIGFENDTLWLFRGTAYPAYLAGADESVTNNWIAWAGRHGAVTNDEYEAAFLLDVAPAALATCTGALLRVSAFAPTEGGVRLELASDIPGYRFFQPEGDDVTVLGNGFVGLAVARDLADLAGETRPIPVLATVDAATGRAVLDLDFGLYLQALGAPPGYTPPLPASLFARPILTPVRPDLEVFLLLVAEP